MPANTQQDGKPATQEDTGQLLLEAAKTCARQYGITKINIKRVAEEAGVTRQTVYRYYPSSKALVEAVSWHVVSQIIEALDKHLGSVKGFDNKIITSIVFLADRIPKDPYLNQYFAPNHLQSDNMAELFSDTTLQYCRQYLYVLYGKNKISDDEMMWLASLAELMLRTIISLIATPSKSTSTKQGKLDYLNRWLRPLLAFHHP